ncbi:MAG: tetratricopeptide repeat protein [Verrucomicrobiota bacterium]
MNTPSSQRSLDASKHSPDVVEVSTFLGLGGLSPYRIEKTEQATCVRVFWGRLAVWLVVLAGLGWLALAGGIYGFVKYRRGFTEVRYSQVLLLPVDLQQYRRAKGEFLIRQGLAQAEAQEWRAAFSSLRAGLVDVPEHQEARLLVARIFLMAGRPDAASEVLLKGLEQPGAELDYLRTVLGYFFNQQADATVIAFVSGMRGELQPGTPLHRMANTALAYAYFNRGRHVEALATLRETGLTGTPEGHFVAARVAWDRGDRDDAIRQVELLSQRVPTDQEIHRTLIHYLGEEGRWADVRRISLLRQIALPDQPEAYLDQIEACVRSGDEAARVRAEEEFLAVFAEDVPALVRLAERAAARGDADLVARVAARCRALGELPADVAFHWVTALLTKGAHAEADALAVRLAEEGGAGRAERERIILDGLRAVALYGARQPVAAEPLLRPLRETNRVPVPVLLMLAGHLERVGQPVEAERILAHGVELDPLNQPVLVAYLHRLLELGRVEEAAPLITRLLDMRNPPEELLADYSAEVASDRYLFWPPHVELRRQIEDHRARARQARSG